MKRFTVITSSLLLLGSFQSALAFGLGDLTEAASSATAQQNQKSDSSLVGMLTSQLGVTPAQAGGGAAAIFSKASSNMSASDYAQLTSALPEIEKLGGSASTLSSATSMIGKGSSLVEQFSGLGMDGSLVEKFTPIILDYVKTKGSADLMGLLSSAL